ncbi:MAG TPA: MFS transporter, partial [Candidatus Binatia bacterium]|nr:MFS transporter [Candidatus Binatia bacterium]
AFVLAACFPLMSLSMGLTFVRETPTRASRAAFLETWRGIRGALGSREIWLVAGFIFFFWFSPSFGPAFLYYQTDTLKFSQQFIGRLAALGAVSGVVGAVLYAPLSRRLSLKSIMHISIALGVLAMLSYLFYRDAASAVVITVAFGALGMIFNLGFLDLAAKACPPRVEATFFAALMSVLNAATKLSENVGARLYDVVGYEWLVWIGAGMTALTWLLMPLVKFDQIDARARQEAAASAEEAAATT